MLRIPRTISTLVILFGISTSAIHAADEAVYFLFNVDELRPYVPAGALDARAGAAEVPEQNRTTMRPQISVDGPGEAYWYSSAGHRFDLSAGDGNSWGRIAVRMPKKADIVGKLHFPNPTYTAFRAVPLKVPAEKCSSGPRDRDVFLLAKRAHYERLIQEGLPGGAWFRHQLRLVDSAFDDPTSAPRSEARAYFDSFRPASHLDDTFSLDAGAGSRAISENLQLDQVLPAAAPESVRLDSIEGPPLKEIDWKPYLKDKKPTLDPLAAYVPFDQYVVFFPSPAAMTRLAHEAEMLGTPLMQASESQSHDLHIADRYQRQMGLLAVEVGPLLGPEVIKSLALTGGDFDFVLGTDIALLFETGEPFALRVLLRDQISLQTAGEPEVKHELGNMLGVSYESWRNGDRTVSSYLATLGEVVVVTNSPNQLRNVIEARHGKRPTIAGLDAYRFYRDRYRSGDADETGLLFLSGAASHRWSGPRSKIAESRRVRDRAVLSELQAANLPALAAGAVEAQVLRTDLRLSAGDVQLTAAGVRSSAMGSLNFITPIGELEFDEVTQAEADAYLIWRDGSRSNTDSAGEPIAFRFQMAEDRLAVDTYVSSRISDGYFEEYAILFKGAKLKPTSGDPHGALVHGVLAFDRQSVQQLVEGVLGFGSQPRSRAPWSPGLSPLLGWMGQSIAVYADDSPFWDEFFRLPTDTERDEFLLANLFRMPVAVNIEVSSALHATAMLAAARGLIDFNAPGATAWEALQHGEYSYVKVRPTERAELPELAKDAAIYYALTADSLTVSPSEDVIKRVLDRHAARTGPAAIEPNPTTEKADAKPRKGAAPAEPDQWLGGNFSFELGERAFRELVALAERERGSKLRKLSWGNLPALNEWKRMFPDQDPVALHERLWGAKLVCPGGGKYVWNEKWRTMESTVYGHPGKPKEGGEVLPQFGEFRGVRFGLSLEDQGMRVRAELNRRQ